MDNSRDHSVIDWILQLDSIDSTSKQQQSIIINNQTQPQQLTSSVPTPSRTDNMTKSDLFEFYLGGEIGHVMDDSNDNGKQQQQQTKRPAQLVDDDDKQSTVTAQKRTKKTSSGGGVKPLSGRLDFRPTMTDQVPESQLKSMSPRERRQLRNKISARNFRNRRKEYMSTLEEELDDCKTENNKLHSELATMKEKITQLENENKQLRLDLVLYEQGINPATKSATTSSTSSSSSSSSSVPNSDQLQLYQHNTSLPLPSTSDTTTTTLSSFELSPGTIHGLSSDSSASPPDLNILHDFASLHQTALTHHQSYQEQPFYFGQQQQQQQQQQQTAMTSVWNMPSTDFNLHDMFLSHAMMPNWDVNQMLSKANEQSPLHPANNVNVMDTFQRYPLLAPALMSIVIGHTMTLSTNELLTLNLPTTNTTTRSTNYYDGFNDKRSLKIWELLQPLATTLHRKSITGTENEQPSVEENENTNANINKDMEEKDESLSTTEAPDAYHEEKCMVASVVAVFQRYLKTYICASVHNYMEHCCRQGSQVQQQHATLTTEDSHDDIASDEFDEKNNNSGDENDDLDTIPPPRHFTPLCKHFRRAKELFIPVA